jgi:hypothetical protein
MLLGARFAEVIIPGANAETEIVAGVDIARNATRANSSEFIVAVVIIDFLLSIDSRVDSNSSTDTITIGQPIAIKRDMMMLMMNDDPVLRPSLQYQHRRRHGHGENDVGAR